MEQPGVRRGLPRPTEGAPPPAGVTPPVAPTSSASPITPPIRRAVLGPAAVNSAAAEATWKPAVAPRTRPEGKRYWRLTLRQWLVAAVALVVLGVVLVLAVRWLVTVPPVVNFLHRYPGEYALPSSAPVGLPGWVGWQHFFSAFLMVLIIRSGLQVRSEKRPSAYWRPRWTKDSTRKISLTLWFHQSLDILWLTNGVIYIVLLFVTAQWLRIVPTSWEVFPNALSALVQYVSLDWPTENGWFNYNSLQQLAYFVTVFLAAPLAAVTGFRMSGLWPRSAKRLSTVYPIGLARAVHFPVMLYFVTFIVMHVTLVLATGALRNLNHMYAGQDVVNWLGFGIFMGSTAVIAAAWIVARPVVLAPIARLFGTVSGR